MASQPSPLGLIASTKKLVFRAPKTAEQISGVLLDKYFQSAFVCYSLKIQPGMRFKFCTCNKTGTITLGVDIEIIGLLLCFALLCYSKAVIPDGCPPLKAQVFQQQELQLYGTGCQRSEPHQHYSSGPALFCNLGQKAMSSSPQTWDTQKQHTCGVLQ